MQHPFQELRPEYESLLLRMRTTQAAAVDSVARRLLKHKARYVAVVGATRIPVVLLATLHERESGADFTTNLAQGDPLTRPSTHVPKGRPPLGAPPNDHFPVTWEYAAQDAIRYDHLGDLSVPRWTMAYACWKAEAWNGFGPRNHGRYSGYLWSGTSVYDGGKYVADGVWNPKAWDKQLGVVPVMMRMMELDASLVFADIARAGVIDEKVPEVPMKPPVGVGGDHSVKWIQTSLNALGYGPLAVDGSYGRMTREAVRAFQASHGLKADGLAGPATIPRLQAEAAKKI